MDSDCKFPWLYPGKKVVNLVGRHGNAGAGEVAAVAMGFALSDNSPR